MFLKAQETSQDPHIHQLPEEISNRISTATVVANIEGAVRQLIDNSLDAEASQIEIRADENGYNSFEVIDNGTGIEAENYDKICKPHHTSKLKDLTGFQSLTTLGFRGQALNALCALSSLTILTRSSTSLLGAKMVFDHKGMQIEQKKIARQVGTTITVNSLFNTLPVRRKEFSKSSKREFAKVISCIQCFALSRPDVKFICSNSVNGKRVQLICTSGNGKIEEVVNSLFGGNIDKSKMIDLRRSLPDTEICSSYGLDSAKMADYDDLILKGFISSCAQGHGRSTADRQFIFINNRPIDYPKVTSTINEVYKQYNKKQFPTSVLFIQVPPDMIDVNVTPDKRTVFFDKERELLALLRASLKYTFESSLSEVDNSLERRDEKIPQPLSSQVPSIFDMMKDFAAPKKRLSGLIDDTLQKKKKKLEKEESNRRTLESFSFKITSHKSDIPPDPKNNEVPVPSTSYQIKPMKDIEIEEEISNPPVTSNNVIIEEETIDNSSAILSDSISSNSFGESSERRSFTSVMLTNLSQGMEVHNPQIDDRTLDKIGRRISEEEQNQAHLNNNQAEASPADSSQSVYLRPQQLIKFNVASFRERMKQIKERKLLKTEKYSNTNVFCAAANCKEEAEEELSRRLSKQDFQQMKVVGQFNKAFIIARLQDNLFLIDQHAADEKYNFERFQKKAKINTQPLFKPQKLDFGRVQEVIIHDNLNIFEANGFEFEFREDENGDTAAFIKGVPEIYSKQYNKNDVDELISVLREFPGQMYRPAKTRAIFASRACRKSVMIGTTLTNAQMSSIIQNLATLNQPWNCPHGRPTLRHLLNLCHFENKLQLKK